MISSSFNLIWQSVNYALSIINDFNNSTAGTFFTWFIGGFCMIIAVRFIIMPFVNRTPIGNVADSLVRKGRSDE